MKSRIREQVSYVDMIVSRNLFYCNPQIHCFGTFFKFILRFASSQHCGTILETRGKKKENSNLEDYLRSNLLADLIAISNMSSSTFGRGACL